MIGQWFSPSTPVSATNKTDCHDITEILLKVALNTITLTPSITFLLSGSIIKIVIVFADEQKYVDTYFIFQSNKEFAQNEKKAYKI